MLKCGHYPTPDPAQDDRYDYIPYHAALRLSHDSPQSDAAVKNNPAYDVGYDSMIRRYAIAVRSS